MRKLIMSAAILAAVLALPRAAHAESPLDEANREISAKHYDAAIAVLEGFVAANPNSVQGELLLATAYHWEKNFAKAELHYQRAAAIDPRYRLEIIPLLDELGDSAGIIRLAAPEVDRGARLSPGILVSLASAYKRTDKPLDAQRIRNLLTNTEYADQSDKDYKNYALAVFALWDGDTQRAKDRLRDIKDKAYLQYARTDDDFKALFNDSEF